MGHSGRWLTWKAAHTDSTDSLTTAQKGTGIEQKHRDLKADLTENLTAAQWNRPISGFTRCRCEEEKQTHVSVLIRTWRHEPRATTWKRNTKTTRRQDNFPFLNFKDWMCKHSVFWVGQNSFFSKSTVEERISEAGSQLWNSAKQMWNSILLSTMC